MMGAEPVYSEPPQHATSVSLSKLDRDLMAITIAAAAQNSQRTSLRGAAREIVAIEFEIDVKFFGIGDLVVEVDAVARGTEPEIQLELRCGLGRWNLLLSKVESAEQVPAGIEDLHNRPCQARQ
jgi:hypothetical protein